VLDRLSDAWGRLLEWGLGLACALLFALMTIICADVLLRNVPLIPSSRGFPAANELAEFALYLITMFTAPWLLRQGQHIRVDILLRALPKVVAWAMEWCMDVLALACCLVMTWYGARSIVDSRAADAVLMKSFTIPEWWTFVPMPITFLLLSVEMLFRMRRLHRGPRAPRDEAVSAS
jgi:TRAP-type C4-dicarboxylate transport system permease small subunit